MIEDATRKQREDRVKWPEGGKPVEPGSKAYEEWEKALREVGK